MVNYITGRWATKYKYLPDDIRFEGSCEERIQHLKARGYGLYSNIGKGIVYWQENCHRLKEEERLLKVRKEEQRLFDIKKAEEAKIQLQTEQTIYDAGVAEAQRLQKIADQEITFNEQTNSGDFNETPITDVNLSSGCSECTGEIRYDPIEVSSMPPSYQSQGYHKMPDGSLMKDSEMEKGNNMKFVGVAAAGIIGLLLYTKGVLK